METELRTELSPGGRSSLAGRERNAGKVREHAVTCLPEERTGDVSSTPLSHVPRSRPSHCMSSPPHLKLKRKLQSEGPAYALSY